MSKESKLLNSLSRAFPDDRPITALQIIESLDKCPNGFYPVHRTYDQDQDADLWREGSFIRKKTRYLCISKTEGSHNLVLKDLVVINEKSIPTEGFSLISRTADSEQRAWRKKQITYKLANKRFTQQAVTDIIVCSRLKKAPDGFSFAGEINGVIVCYKMGNVQDAERNLSEVTPAIGPPPARPPRHHQPGIYPSIAQNNDGDHDYEILNPPGYVPTRPAPQPPPVTSGNGGMSSFHALDGVPFVLNSKLMGTGNNNQVQIPIIKARTMQQLLRDYDYPFTVERQT
ncbi:multivesicular body subunit 12B [Onthophagus taurus]|uniref:multivesicular body subunit 12B n=1 Tax=Onthophagus taurus TaxID=166361 RepID=UPI0039BEC9CC